MIKLCEAQKFLWDLKSHDRRSPLSFWLVWPLLTNLLLYFWMDIILTAVFKGQDIDCCQHLLKTPLLKFNLFKQTLHFLSLIMGVHHINCMIGSKLANDIYLLWACKSWQSICCPCDTFAYFLLICSMLGEVGQSWQLGKRLTLTKEGSGQTWCSLDRCHNQVICMIKIHTWEVCCTAFTTLNNERILEGGLCILSPLAFHRFRVLVAPYWFPVLPCTDISCTWWLRHFAQIVRLYKQFDKLKCYANCLSEMQLLNCFKT